LRRGIAPGFWIYFVNWLSGLGGNGARRGLDKIFEAMIRASSACACSDQGNSAANLIAVMKEAGFADAAKVGRWSRLIGSVG
jgi:hypothetical protein